MGISFKSGIERILQTNTHLNKWFYDLATRQETVAFQETLANLSTIDTLEDMSELMKFRTQIDNGTKWYTRNQNVTNCCSYGIWVSLFPFLDRQSAIFSPAVEHGFIPGNDVTHELKKTARMTCATFGGYRKRIIQSKIDMPVFTVGPYIRYAKAHYDMEKMASIKKDVGKTLCFFLSHSVDVAKVQRNEAKLLTMLHAQATGFDTVFVNLFWMDLEEYLVDLLTKEGFRVVSAGFQNDPAFLCRLRTLFELSDVIASDSLGTHVAYSTAMSKPFKLIDCDSHQGDDPTQSHQMKNHAHIMETKLCAALANSEDSNAIRFLNDCWGLNIYRDEREREAMIHITTDLLALTKGYRAQIIREASKLYRMYEEKGQTYESTLLKGALPCM